jgi:hypothetical protein
LGGFGFEMKFVRAEDIESTTNEVVDHFADAGAKLTVNLVEDSDVLLEGDAESLEFLANYLLAYVRGDEHARNIGPNSAGGVFFSEKSTKGLYIHILPCRHGHSDE